MPETVMGVVKRAGAVSYWIVPAQAEHLRQIAEGLREKDREEILRSGVSVNRALWRAYRNSILCKVAFIDGKIAAIWGLCVGLRNDVSLMSDLGVPWLHTTAAIEAAPRAFVVEALRELRAMRQLRPQMESYVDAEYGQARRLLQMLGFAVDQPQPVGINGSQFCRFHVGMNNNNAAPSAKGA